MACSSSDDITESINNNENNGSTFSIDFLYNETAQVDETLEVTITSNEPMKSLEISFDNFETSFTSFSDLGSSILRYFSFDKLGANTVYFKAKNGDDAESIKTINVTISRGNAVKLQSLKLNSFYNMGNIWDDEYGPTDPNRLADVFFWLLKPKIDVIDGTIAGIGSWYRADTRDNESNLIWNFQDEALYVNLDILTAYIAFADDDGGGVAQDLMLGPPLERVIPLTEYLNTKPNTILVQETDINLEYELTLDW
tara:strand:+ start:1043 stop:1804 length:762 start_codon:yes stop_codon:yes gene_type:complete